MCVCMIDGLIAIHWVLRVVEVVLHAVHRIHTWMEKCDERLQRFSTVTDQLEVHRGDTSESVLKLEARLWEMKLSKNPEEKDEN